MEEVSLPGFDCGEDGVESASVLCPLFCKQACAAVRLPKVTGADDG